MDFTKTLALREDKGSTYGSALMVADDLDRSVRVAEADGFESIWECKDLYGKDVEIAV